MTTITVDGVHADTEHQRGFFSRALERISEAQMQRARALAKPHLLTLSDAELETLGYTRDEIDAWPQGANWL
jgi:uncharacterized protein YjiS (DUF1127 family)